MLSGRSRANTLSKLPQSRIAIGFSGGGDSTALVHLCRDLRPSPLILIVDHALRTGSAAEAKAAQIFAQSFGLETQILTWKHSGIVSGIQEKARKARYSLMGDACRKSGIKYLLTAHTADDQAETLLMRYENGTGWRGAAGMVEKSYGPIWPELAEVILLRPLLDVSRAKLRAYNKVNDLNWIHDPSNEDRKYERIRARDYLSLRPRTGILLRQTAGELRSGLDSENKHLRETMSYDVDEFGLIYTAKNIPTQFLKYCLMAAGGTGEVLTKSKLKAFAYKIRQFNFKSANIMGALCLSRGDQLIFGPDPVIYKGRNNQDPIEKITTSESDTHIWDGRFLVSSESSVKILPAQQSNGAYWPDLIELSSDLKEIPSEFRGSMPVFWQESTGLLGIGSFETLGFSSICLVGKRIEQLLGQ